MNEARVYADGFERSFAEVKDLLEFLAERGRNAKWIRKPTNTLRLAPLEKEAQNLDAADASMEEILEDTEKNERRYEFLRCMGMKQKQRRKTIRLETQMLSDIALFATVMMGIVYVLSYEWRCASKDAGSLDVTFWMYWILIVGIYLLADRLVQWLFAQYVIKRVEKGND